MVIVRESMTNPCNDDEYVRWMNSNIPSRRLILMEMGEAIHIHGATTLGLILTRE